jgi:hypothetical protein
MISFGFGVNFLDYVVDRVFWVFCARLSSCRQRTSLSDAGDGAVTLISRHTKTTCLQIKAEIGFLPNERSDSAAAAANGNVILSEERAQHESASKWNHTLDA